MLLVKPWFRAVWLVLGLLFQAGCLYLPAQPKPVDWLTSPPPSVPNGPDASLFQATLAVAALLILFLGLRHWASRLAQGKNPPVNREDLALLRTARDALRLLLQRQKNICAWCAAKIFSAGKIHLDLPPYPRSGS